MTIQQVFVMIALMAIQVLATLGVAAWNARLDGRDEGGG